MNELRAGIERARLVLETGMRAPVVSPGPWEEIIGQLEAALEREASGDKRATLQHVGVAREHLKMLAMMKRGTFELMDMEDARRDALKALDRLPRAI
jgi:hypothetical protein